MTEELVTQVIVVDSDNPDVTAIHQAAAAIRQGKLVAFPTETVYGLGANALDAAAIARIFAAKGRPASNPLIVHLAGTEQLSTVTTTIPDPAWQLLAAFSPGPLTLVLPRCSTIPAIVSAGLPTIAVRIPSHPVAQALLVAANVPIAAPSANRSTHPSPTIAAHVLEDLQGRIDLVIDGGATPIGLESTVVDLTHETPRLLRPGSVSLEHLLEVVPSLELNPHYASTHTASSSTTSTSMTSINAVTASASPGMMFKHYSPNAQVLLLQGDEVAVRAKMQQIVTMRVQEGKQVGLLLVEHDAHRLSQLFSPPMVTIVSLGAADDLAAIAHRLFAGLRDLDRWGADVILVRTVDPQGLGLAIWDRLFRAAEGQIIHCE